MKKLAFLLLSSFVLLSCGDDDSNASRPRPTTVVLGSDGESRNFTYDNKGRIATMTLIDEDDTDLFTFTYGSENKLATIAVGTNLIEVNYEDGKFVSLSEEGQVTLTVVHTGEHTFTIEGQPYGYTPQDDWQSFGNATLVYDSKKGAFANVKGIEPLIFYVLDPNTLFYMSKKRLKTITAEGQTYDVVTNEDKGLPTDIKIEQAVYSFQYSE